MTSAASICLALLLVSPAGAASAAQDILDISGARGGLVVHVGCGDGRLTAALGVDHRFLVHGLDASSENVEQARTHIRKQNVYGRVSVELWQCPRLPYNDNLVTLLVVETPGTVPQEEITRVLCPGGVACVRQDDGSWAKTVKPWPAEIDEWTHFLYDASNNAVAKDKRVGPPRHLQWMADPKRTRDHDALSSFTTMTSSGGRVFYILDEGPTSQVHRRPRWRLVARDAFNGVLLWKRTIDSWVTHLYNFRAGPVQMPRRLVSVGDRVYVTLGYDAPVTQLDAATGKTLRTYEGSRNTEELLLDDGVLLAVLGDPKLFEAEAPKIDGYWETRVDANPSAGKSIVAYRAESGKLLWKIRAPNLGYLVPLSLTADHGKVFYLDHEHLHCVDLKTGRALWKAPYRTEGLFLRNYAPTVVLHDGVVVCLSIDKMAAFDVADGKQLWSKEQGYYGFASPGDLFVIGDLVWTFPGTQAIRYESKDRVLGARGREFWALALRTGEVKQSIAKADVWPGGHHHRCYRNKATENFAVCGRRGLEFVDLTGGDNNVINWWVRGICQYGIMPCNGMVYAPPDPCQCFSTIKVDGLLALVAENSLDGVPQQDEDRLHRGPAYRNANPPRAGSDASADEWPTYRRDMARSGATTSAVRGTLERKWTADIGGRPSGVVVAGGKLLVSAIDRHAVHCLSADTGRPLWQFTAGGPVDSPPTLHDGLAIFGCRDGRVYAVDADDGRLAWSFRAGPADRRIVCREHLESVWPVHGSVLVLDNVVYFTAGRSSFLDGGIRLYGLKAASGKKLYETRVDSTPAHDNNRGALPDVLTSDGTMISMRHLRFDKQLRSHAGRRGNFAARTGFLEDCWGHRLTWRMDGAAGNLLVFDDRFIYGAQSRYAGWKKNKANWPSTHSGHLHQKYSRYQPEWFPIGNRLFAEQRGAAKQTRRNRDKAAVSWAHDLPIQVRAMVLAGDTLLAAGWPDAVTILDQVEPAATERELQEPTLWAIGTKDGRELTRSRLDALPVFDGAAVAYGQLFMALEDGTVICLKGQ